MAQLRHILSSSSSSSSPSAAGATGTSAAAAARLRTKVLRKLGLSANAQPYWPGEEEPAAGEDSKEEGGAQQRSAQQQQQQLQQQQRNQKPASILGGSTSSATSSTSSSSSSAPQRVALHPVVSYPAITQRDFFLFMGIEARLAALLRNCATIKEQRALVDSAKRLVEKDQMGELFKVMAIVQRDVAPAGWADPLADETQGVEYVEESLPPLEEEEQEQQQQQQQQQKEPLNPANTASGGRQQ